MQGPYFLISGVQVLSIVNWIRNNPSLEPTGKAMDIVSGMNQLTRVPEQLIPMLMQQQMVAATPIPQDQEIPPVPPVPEKKPNGVEETPAE